MNNKRLNSAQLKGKIPKASPRFFPRAHPDLDGAVVTAGAHELGSPPGWVAGVDKGRVALEPLHPLAGLAVPHSHGFVRGCREEHAAGNNLCEGSALFPSSSQG